MNQNDIFFIQSNSFHQSFFKMLTILLIHDELSIQIPILLNTLFQPFVSIQGISVDSKYQSDDECPICIGTLLESENTDNKLQIFCKNGHYAHTKCMLKFIDSQLKLLCPVCRDELVMTISLDKPSLSLNRIMT